MEEFKSSRPMPVQRNTNQPGSFQLEVDWDKATANLDYIFIPGRPPHKRKRRNKWTDIPPDQQKKLLFVKEAVIN